MVGQALSLRTRFQRFQPAIRPAVLLVVASIAAISVSAQPNRRYPSPVDIAVSPDGNRLYIVCEGTDELLVADAVQKSVIARLLVGRVPRGITLSAGGSEFTLRIPGPILSAKSTPPRCASTERLSAALSPAVSRSTRPARRCMLLIGSPTIFP